MNASHDLGKEGEKAAVAYLQEKGYSIRHVNWKHHRIELDIIAETPDYLVIVEVKTRRNDVFSEPYEAVNTTKIKHIVNATQAYVFRYNIHKDVRFDIISILLAVDAPEQAASAPQERPHFVIEHIQDAFLPPVQ